MISHVRCESMDKRPSVCDASGLCNSAVHLACSSHPLRPGCAISAQSLIQLAPTPAIRLGTPSQAIPASFYGVGQHAEIQLGNLLP